MNNSILMLLPLGIVIASLIVSMYLVFDADALVAENSDTAQKQFIAGASCPATPGDDIQFVGCGGFF